MFLCTCDVCDLVICNFKENVVSSVSRLGCILFLVSGKGLNPIT